MKYETMPLTGEDESYIEKKIGEYAYTMAPPEPGTPDAEQMVFKAEDTGGCIAGGCVVNIHEWGRAVLALLWVDERHRRQGLGSMLIRQAEHAASEKGCHYMCLGTMDFMARGFYEKHGYSVFTVNRDFPKGHEGWSLSKRIDKDAPDYLPTNNCAVTRFTIRPGSKEDEELIGEGLARYDNLFVPDEHDCIPISRKLVDPNGEIIAGVVAEIGGWNECDLDGIWVEERYRNQGFGSFLLRETERVAKESGAHVLFTHACDWVTGFFTQNGYTVRGELPDYPKGHHAYELEKRI